MGLEPHILSCRLRNASEICFILAYLTVILSLLNLKHTLSKMQVAGPLFHTLALPTTVISPEYVKT